MTLSNLFKDYITFKLYTWHTLHGESVVDISVKLLGVVFADFTRPTLLSKIMSIFICRITSVVVTSLFLAKAFYAESIGDFARVTESVMVGIQTINDQILGIGLMQAKLAELYYKRENFWSRKDIDPEDTCGESKKQKLTLIFGNILLLVLYLAYAWFILSYFLYGKLDLWVPQSHPKIALAISVYGIMWGFFCATGTAIFNLLLVSFCVEIQVQFQLINYRLSKLEGTWQRDNSTIKEMKSIVQHHSFLLVYWKELRETFTFILLIRIFQAVGILCMGLFILGAEKFTSLYDTIRSILLNGCLTQQLVVMVLSSEIVENESSKVFDTAYATSWNEHKEIAPYIKILMARAMTPCNLNAGRLIDINKSLLTSIIKKTFTFYTAMKAMADFN